MVIEVEPGVMLPIDEKFIDGCRDEFQTKLSEIKFTDPISKEVLEQTFKSWFLDYKLQDMQRVELKQDALTQLNQNRYIKKESEGNYQQLIEIITDL